MIEDSEIAGAEERREPDSGDQKQEEAVSWTLPGKIVTPTSISTTLKVATFLVIVAGILSLGNGISAVTSNGEANVLGGWDVAQYCGVLLLVAGIGAILCGIASVRLRRLSPAFAGAVMGIAGGGLAGFWLGLAAIVFLVLSHEDF